MPKRLFVAFLCGLLLPSLLAVSTTVSAQTSEIDRLENEINSRTNRIVEIDAEIAKFEAELAQVGGEKRTLQSAISKL